MVPQQVTEEQERSAAHAQRADQGDRQLPGRTAADGLLEVAAGDQQHQHKRHDREQHYLPGQQNRQGPRAGYGNVHTGVGVSRIDRPKADT